MATLIQSFTANGRKALATLEEAPTPALIEAVRSNKRPVRLFDAARSKVLVRSDAAKRIVDPHPRPGIERLSMLLLTDARGIEQREPDPYSLPEPRSKRTRIPGRYPLFSET